MKSLAKSTLRRISRSKAFELIADGACSLGRRQRQLRVLTYHRIDEPTRRPDFYAGLISASPDEFERQVRYIAKRYSVISAADLMASLDGQIVLPNDSVLLTFDDATTDFLEFAWPVLKRLQLPATVFVPTAYPDQNRHFWWDRLFRALMKSRDGLVVKSPDGYDVKLDAEKNRSRLFRLWRDALKRLPNAEMNETLNELVAAGQVDDPDDNNVLSWELLRDLSNDGVTLAPHSRTHPMLNQISQDALKDEIAGSHTDLEEKLEKSVPRILAYPAGGVNSDVVATMSKLKFQLGFTTSRGCNSLEFESPFLLNRINVGKNTTPSLIRLQFENWL